MKKLKKLWKWLNKPLGIKALLLGSFVIFFIGTWYFHVGFHNIDVAYNRYSISEATGIVIHDIRSFDREVQDSKTIFMEGMEQITFGFVVSIVGVGMFAYGVGRIIT